VAGLGRPARHRLEHQPADRRHPRRTDQCAARSDAQARRLWRLRSSSSTAAGPRATISAGACCLVYASMPASRDGVGFVAPHFGGSVRPNYR